MYSSAKFPLICLESLSSSSQNDTMMDYRAQTTLEMTAARHSWTPKGGSHWIKELHKRDEPHHMGLWQSGQPAATAACRTASFFGGCDALTRWVCTCPDLTRLYRHLA